MIRSPCPICGGPRPVAIEYREGVPSLQNRLTNNENDARAVFRGTLDIAGCVLCGFVWNRSFDPDNIPYDPEYENDQTHSSSFRGHVEKMIAKILDAVGDDGPIDLVEVGCGQGIFLQAFAAHVGDRLRSAVGFDPAFRATSANFDPRIRAFGEYFNKDTVARLERQPSLVLTRHTIEHVPDPIGFLAAIRTGIGNIPARLFVETPDVDWIIARGEIEDLFYEHCSLFGPNSLAIALRSAKFTPTKIDSVFDDQYLWAEAVTNDSVSETSFASAPQRKFPDLSKTRHEFVEHWRRRIAGRSAMVWGAGAKGVTFCTLVDPDRSRIAGLVDINPAKQEKFVPLSCHRVFGPSSLLQLRPQLLIVMNPNYAAEIATTVRSMGLKSDIAVIGGDDINV